MTPPTVDRCGSAGTALAVVRPVSTERTRIAPPRDQDAPCSD